ncbi:hypothetical protein QYE76_068462 [Lolium multiflorum]|uniref:RNase H type-1 domain-containing protein n=1 Tax=Lolium multiflorum TaxID=4521 RepID=A0AAD8WDZ4_LOLMU|nr:hypothetical protein QYE76_068462 [Lolium multiflorum]
MYLETLEKMNLTKEQLKHTTEFHGVVPGKKANSLGSIKLPVAFGNVNNYREEMITFEVVPFKSSYHVIFGRPTYHKFHARACYIYNKLKIRVLTAGSPCPETTRKLGTARKARPPLQNPSYPERSRKATSRGGSDRDADHQEADLRTKTSFKAAIETKKHDLVEGDNSKQVSIHFEATNNMAEYEALLHGLRIAKEIGIKHIICCGDSDLVAQQVAGTWNARNSVMAAYRDEVDEIAKCFLRYEVKSTGFTPFFLVYGSEAVLPTDIIHDSPRVSAYNEEPLTRLDSYLWT